MPGTTKYHLTPIGLRRCRHGIGGISGKTRACPYGGPVTSSKERMGMSANERVPVVRPPSAEEVPPKPAQHDL